MNRISRGGLHIRTNRTRLFHGAVLSAVTVALLVFAGCVTDDEDDDGTDGGGGGGSGWTKATALTLSGNSSNWTRTFTENRQEAWFKFEANGRYDLTVRDRSYVPTGVSQSPYSVDVAVSVTDADGNYITSAYSSRMISREDMGGGSYVETLTFTDLEGTYYVMVEPWYAGNTGNFYIAIERTGGVTDGEDEDNAIELITHTPTTYEREITTSRTERWFMFEADGRYDLIVRDRSYVPTGAGQSTYDLDVAVNVMDANGEFIKSAFSNRPISREDMGGGSYPDTLTFTDLEGVYYVMIEAWYENNFGSFFIDLKRTDDVTDGESIDNAIELVRGAPRATHELTTSRPNRWFAFTAPTSGSVDLTVFDNYYEPTGMNVTKPNVDVGVTVVDDDGEYVGGMIKEDMGANNQSPRTIDGLTPGATYYIMVEPWYVDNFGFFYIKLD